MFIIHYMILGGKGHGSAAERARGNPEHVIQYLRLREFVDKDCSTVFIIYYKIVQPSLIYH